MFESRASAFISFPPSSSSSSWITWQLFKAWTLPLHTELWPLPQWHNESNGSAIESTNCFDQCISDWLQLSTCNFGLEDSEDKRRTTQTTDHERQWRLWSTINMHCSKYVCRWRANQGARRGGTEEWQATALLPIGQPILMLIHNCTSIVASADEDQFHFHFKFIQQILALRWAINLVLLEVKLVHFLFNALHYYIDFLNVFSAELYPTRFLNAAFYWKQVSVVPSSHGDSNHNDDL